MDRGPWWDYSLGGNKESDTTEHLRHKHAQDFTGATGNAGVPSPVGELGSHMPHGQEKEYPNIIIINVSKI